MAWSLRAQDITEFLEDGWEEGLLLPRRSQPSRKRMSGRCFPAPPHDGATANLRAQGNARPAAITATARPARGGCESRESSVRDQGPAHSQQRPRSRGAGPAAAGRARPRAGGAPARGTCAHAAAPLPAAAAGPRRRRAEMAAAVPGASRARAAALLLLLLGCCGAALPGGLQVRGWGSRGGAESGRTGGVWGSVPIAAPRRAGSAPVGCPRSCPEALAARRGGPVGTTGSDTEPRSPALPPGGRSLPALPRGRNRCRERRCLVQTAESYKPSDFSSSCGFLKLTFSLAAHCNLCWVSDGPCRSRRAGCERSQGGGAARAPRPGARLHTAGASGFVRWE